MNAHPVTLAAVGLAIAALWSAGTPAAECSARSGPHRTALVELYTSEGCSSCPPADRWLSGLRDAGFASTTLIPLAFHVDYWNQLGWPDRFSQPAFSDRQRVVSARNRLDFVYTPQFVIDGRDVRSPGDYDAVRRQFAKPAPERAAIDVRLSGNAGQIAITATARLAPGERSPDPQLFVALTEDRLATQVAAGENRGRQLRHDAVVRTLLGHVAVAADGTATFERGLAVGPDWNAANLSVVAFVQDRSTGDILQALTLPVCR